MPVSRVVNSNGIDDLACGIAQRLVQRVNIFHSSNLKYCTGQALYFIDGLVHAIAFRYGSKHFTGFADLDNAFLRDVFLNDLNDGHAAFLAGSVLRHIKIHRLGRKSVPIGGKLLHQRIARSVFQRLRRNQVALRIGVKGINLGDFRVGESLRNQAPVRAVKLEASTRIRNYLAGFRVHLNNFDIRFKVGVID